MFLLHIIHSPSYHELSAFGSLQFVCQPKFSFTVQHRGVEGRIHRRAGYTARKF